MAVTNTYWRLQEKTSHEREALDRFISQFRDKPGFAALMGVLTDQVQELEGVLWDVYQTFNIDAATGIYLDRIGALIGQPRQGLDDANYRVWLRARLRVNVSNGTADELLQILQVLDPGGTYTYITFPPATYEIVMSTTTLDPTVVADILEQAQPAGVQGMLSSAEEDLFLFGPGTYVTTDPDHGFGDTSDASVGGYLADTVVF